MKTKLTPQELEQLNSYAAQDSSRRTIGSVMQTAFANIMADGTPHVEHVVSWLNQMCSRHAIAMQQMSNKTEPVLRGLQKSLNQLESDIGELCDSNVYSLRYLSSDRAG